MLKTSGLTEPEETTST